jgi:hypothetical protein
VAAAGQEDYFIFFIYFIRQSTSPRTSSSGPPHCSPGITQRNGLEHIASGVQQRPDRTTSPGIINKIDQSTSPRAFSSGPTALPRPGLFNEIDQSTSHRTFRRSRHWGE